MSKDALKILSPSPAAPPSKQVESDDMGGVIEAPEQAVESDSAEAKAAEETGAAEASDDSDGEAAVSDNADTGGAEYLYDSDGAAAESENADGSAAEEADIAK